MFNFIFKPSSFALSLWCPTSSITYLERATQQSNTAWKWLQIFAKSPFLCFWEFQPFPTSGFTGTPLSLFGRWFLLQFFDLCQLMGCRFYSIEWDWSPLEKLTSLWWPTEGCVAVSPFPWPNSRPFNWCHKLMLCSVLVWSSYFSLLSFKVKGLLDNWLNKKTAKFSKLAEFSPPKWLLFRKRSL